MESGIGGMVDRFVETFGAFPTDFKPSNILIGNHADPAAPDANNLGEFKTIDLEGFQPIKNGKAVDPLRSVHTTGYSYPRMIVCDKQTPANDTVKKARDYVVAMNMVAMVGNGWPLEGALVAKRYRQLNIDFQACIDNKLSLIHI